jgi:dihydrofolate reductase
MIISMISAMGKNRVIGKGNKMMWRLPKEWQFFKEKTMGHCLITGRKNIQAQGRALPGRTNIVITRDRSFTFENCVIVYSIHEALEYAQNYGETEVFICGGGQIYKESLPLVDKLYLTIVDYEEDGEVYFPEFDENNYVRSLLNTEVVADDNKYAWQTFLYEKKSS